MEVMHFITPQRLVQLNPSKYSSLRANPSKKLISSSSCKHDSRSSGFSKKERDSRRRISFAGHRAIRVKETILLALNENEAFPPRRNILLPVRSGNLVPLCNCAPGLLLQLPDRKISKFPDTRRKFHCRSISRVT